eukprot:GFUD01097967.1.p1 GENE.GFUD01097967.1~~GFUD01097967.1.p1  ORF type:complete len:246 (+),score=57.93 GFUD01097967.1:101-838(+)
MHCILITAVLISIAHANVTKIVFPDDENDDKTQSHFDTMDIGDTTTRSVKNPTQKQIDDKMKSLLEENSPTEQSNNKKHWCSPENYPGNTISSLIKKNSSLLELFDDDIRTFDVRPREPLQENICHTESEYILPKAAKSKKGKFMFIVNSPAGSEEYIQLVKVTTCKAAGQECAQGQLLNSISTICHQEYSDHKLVVLSETGEELVVDTFSFPSCCSCVFNINSVFSRIGRSTSNVPATTNNLFC